MVGEREQDESEACTCKADRSSNSRAFSKGDDELVLLLKLDVLRLDDGINWLRI